MNARTVKDAFADYVESLPVKANDADIEEGLRRYKRMVHFVLFDPELISRLEREVLAIQGQARDVESTTEDKA